MKKLSVTGNVGRDPKVEVNPNTGTELITFTVASYNGKDKSGKEKPPSWVKVILLNNDSHLARYVLNNIVTGSKVLVEGRHEASAYINSNTNKAQCSESIYLNEIECFNINHKASENPSPDNVHEIVEAPTDFNEDSLY